MISRKEQKAIILPTIFFLVVIASIWMAVTNSQASSSPAGDAAGGAATEGKAFWHKDIKGQVSGKNGKSGAQCMENKKAKFDMAVDEGQITAEQKETLLDIFTRFHEGEITWEEKLRLIEEAGIDLKQLFGHGSKWKSDKSPAQAL